ncbi:MAG: hypothetical protein A3K19_27690 [Lentisphaerae bacterium RIFOXYB12_FULL_65_16]|nr:MAG: hypothetical protein A3K18_20705 [Lentisphaerae bacterium RIFOXYA12_64_32]OGV84183.1 MAG: hypothetical protein A3K19_27690 [Lentisphaerae bacterium RIFOXYB12_FULL_65_16]
MPPRDQQFVDAALNTSTRQALVSRLRLTRTCSYLACGAFFLAAVVCLAAEQSGLCALFAALSAIDFVLATGADVKIKLALLAERLAPTAGKADPVPPSPGSPTAGDAS